MEMYQIVAFLKQNNIHAEYIPKTGVYRLTAHQGDWKPIIILRKINDDLFELWDAGGLEAAHFYVGQNPDTAVTIAAAKAAAAGFNYYYGVRAMARSLEEVLTVYQQMIQMIEEAAKPPHTP